MPTVPLHRIQEESEVCFKKKKEEIEVPSPPEVFIFLGSCLCDEQMMALYHWCWLIIQNSDGVQKVRQTN
jgi:hypothetical protein